MKNCLAFLLLSVIPSCLSAQYLTGIATRYSDSLLNGIFILK